MDFKLDNDAMRDLIAKTILESMTDEKRDELMRKAIVSLMAPETSGSYGQPKITPLEYAFRSAADAVARDIANKELAASEDFNAKLRQLFLDVVEKLFASEIREKLVDTIASTVVNNLRPRDY